MDFLNYESGFHLGGNDFKPLLDVASYSKPVEIEVRIGDFRRNKFDKTYPYPNGSKLKITLNSNTDTIYTIKKQIEEKTKNAIPIKSQKIILKREISDKNPILLTDDMRVIDLTNFPKYVLYQSSINVRGDR
jgi:hypothetical protein